MKKHAKEKKKNQIFTSRLIGFDWIDCLWKISLAKIQVPARFSKTWLRPGFIFHKFDQVGSRFNKNRLDKKIGL